MTKVTIERLGRLGDGVANGPVFAARTLPGEVVEGRLEGNRLEGVRIKTPSSHRVRPPCGHFKSCGGCSLQHASDLFVADWKREIVEKALFAQGLETKADEIITSPAQSRRRAVFSARRTKGGALIGFHAPGSEAITAIPDCRLLHPDIIAAFPILREIVERAGSRKGAMKIAVNLSRAGLDVMVSGGKTLDAELEMKLARFAQERGVARLSWGGEVIALLAPPVQKFGPALVVPPPGAFLQATEQGEAALQREVAAGLAGASRVADLFAGCGTFTFPLTEFCEVHAVEGDEEMLSSLDRGWRNTNGLKRVTTEARDLFRRPLLSSEIEGFDAVVIDPPRAGAEAQMREIAASSLKRVVAVSCNPVSFARDARILAEAGFSLVRLVVVDQFRWSTHVELVAQFTR